MGVSLYVMPLRTYLTGRFKTTWAIRREQAGGLDGFYMTSEGAVAAPPPRKGLAPADAEAVVARLQAALGGASWDESAEALSATTMSYGALGSVCDLAGRGPFRMLRDLLQPYWLPVDFDAAREIPDPRGGTEPLTVLSSVAVRRELDAALALLAADERSNALRSLPAGSAVPGELAGFAALLRSAGHVRAIAALSESSRVPVVVEE